MPVTIPDETLRETGRSEREVLIELACHLFNKQWLALWPAARLAGLTRSQFEEELIERGIPVYRPTLQDLDHDLQALDRLGV